MSTSQKTISCVLATVLVAVILGSAVVAHSVSAVTDNSHQKGLKTVGNGIPDGIRGCILQHLNDPKYAHIGVGHCIQGLP